MPEGPEIRRAADRVYKAVADGPLERVELRFEHLQPWEGELLGQHITEIDTHGKAMLTRFSGGMTLYSHNQLYGRWQTARAGADPKTNRRLRVALGTAKRSALLYSATDVDLLNSDELALHPFLQRLGPDALWKQLNPAEVAERLQSKTFRGRQLAALLLDQGFVAGLGNYLRSEILFLCGLRPETRPKDLDDDTVQQLASEILAVTRRSYRTGGVTLQPSLERELRAAGWHRQRDRFYVFARAGRPCRVCGTPIRKTEQGGRRIYLCDGCQPERSATKRKTRRAS